MDTPQIKFEQSPVDSLAESFVSTPGSLYPLFPPSDTVITSEALTPPLDDDDVLGRDRSESVFQEGVPRETAPDTPTPEKKHVKKRKSWGQQLPEPKTNLPPRKRAKTEDEKEQRRVERVLRNRRAAQSSRERKRLEVEALEAEKRAIERRNHDLELRLADMEAKNAMLQQQIAQMTGGNIPVFKPSSPAPHPIEQFRQSPAPITFSQELFVSRDSHNSSSSNFEQPISEAHGSPQPAVQTVNPASISPEMRPVDESPNASSSDMTQHPAAMLCDLQCQSVEQRPWMNSPLLSTSTSLWVTLFLTITSAFLQPLSQIIKSLKTGSSLSPTTSILNLIMWLATTPMSLTTSTSMTSSTTTPTARTSRHPRFSLRLNLLRRLLACSPQLARPLMDATMGAMRSASERRLLAQNCLRGGVGAHGQSRGANEPSIECLMTLLWATHMFDRERQRLEHAEEVDAVTEIRQASGELEELFRTRNMRMPKRERFFLVGEERRGTGQRPREVQKSFEDYWRLAFKHG